MTIKGQKYMKGQNLSYNKRAKIGEKKERERKKEKKVPRTVTPRRQLFQISHKTVTRD